jgi:DNA-binding beta-propeller fold protein YncE
VTLDKVNNRLLIGHHGNSRYDIYNIDDDGLPVERHAVGSIGASLLGKGFSTPELNDTDLSWPSGGDIDEINQRLFVPERAMTGGPGGRIMVFDIRPEALAALAPGELPRAIAVLGQPDFNTIDPRSGAAGIGASGQVVVDDERQLLFFNDSPNNRVMVWDIDPSGLETGMDAVAVIGQPDFDTTEPGSGASGLLRPSFMAYDQNEKHLYVSDAKKRVMVFDVTDRGLDRVRPLEAFAVIGQTDFDSDAPRTSMRKFSGGGPISLDYQYNRLFSATFTENRVLVFDTSPENLIGASNPDAIAVLGQPDYESTDPAVTQTRLTMTRITVDSERQLAYVPDGYPAGNHINIFDIHPDRMQEFLTPQIDQIGHINPEGDPDFLARSAHDRSSPKYWTQGRDVSVDPVDHRLFMSDNYGHRILIFRLDRMNRLLDRGASWALGQVDTQTSVMLPGRDATTMKLPMAMEYDDSYKRLFVADTWNNRVLAFDMTPGQVESGMAASYVLGQRDFVSYDPDTTADRINFGTRNARGIGPSGGRPAELAIDRTNQRLFVADGENNRVLIFDMHPDRIESGASAIGVIGQDDFTSKDAGLSASRFSLPGDMVFDEENQRLFVELPFQDRILVFDVDPSRFQNGLSASYVIGQPDFTSSTPGLSRSGIRQPDGITYDPANHHLYVTDKYNNRILTFDVQPDRLSNMPEAIAVIGESDFDTVTVGPGVYRHHQDMLFDPRGNYFDPVGRRLFQSEGTNGRLTVFTLPREEYLVDLPARARLRYASTDALMYSGPEPLTSGYSVTNVDDDARLSSVSTHYVTNPLTDEGSLRQSRELVSVAMLATTNAVNDAVVYAQVSANSDTRVSIVNDNDSTARVEFALLGIDGERSSTNRSIAGRSQLSVSASELFGAGDVAGAMSISSNRGINIHALLETEDGNGNRLMSPAPTVFGDNEAAADEAGTYISNLMRDRRVLPSIPTGAGSEVRIVLLNPGSDEMTGTIEITDQQPVRYIVSPGQAFVHDIPSDARPLLQGVGMVRATSGAAPEAFALVSGIRRDGSISSVHTVTSHQEGTLFWAPLDTYPDVLHHGEIETDLHVVNDKTIPATVYLEWFDIDGNSAGKFERTLNVGDRAVLSIEEVFSQSPIRGTLRVFSDSGVSATLLESTKTVTDQLIVMDVPLQTTPTESSSRVVFPLFRNGEGHATEMLMINTDRQAHTGGLEIQSSNGAAVESILR